MAKGAVPVVLFPRWVSPDAMPMRRPADLSGSCAASRRSSDTCGPIFLGFGQGREGRRDGGRRLPRARARSDAARAASSSPSCCWSSGYVSLGSLTSAALLPVLLGITVGVRSPLFVISVLVAVVRLLDASREHRAAAQRRGASVRQDENVPAKRPDGDRCAIALVIAARDRRRGEVRLMRCAVDRRRRVGNGARRSAGVERPRHDDLGARARRRDVDQRAPREPAIPAGIHARAVAARDERPARRRSTARSSSSTRRRRTICGASPPRARRSSSATRCSSSRRRASSARRSRS